MADELYLHPDSVEQIVEGLLTSDIISKDKVAKLKMDTSTNADPNLVMEIRHKEAKRESLIDVDSHENRILLKTILKQNSLKTSLKVKDLKAVDKEIADYRRHLQMFKNQLTKKSDSLTSSIVSLDRARDENTSSPVILSLSEDESKRYFNLHLDHLEDAALSIFPREKQKTWIPFQVKSPPVIDVVTTLKIVDCKQDGIMFDEEELRMLDMCKIKRIRVTGKSLQSSSSTDEVKNVVPSNSPLIDTVNSTKCELTKDDVLKKDNIAQNAIKQWKLYVEIKRTKKFEEEITKKCKDKVLKRYFTSWLKYVQYCKTQRKTLPASKTETEIKPKTNHENSVAGQNDVKSNNLELKQKSNASSFISRSIEQPTKKQNTETVSSTNILHINSVEGNKILSENSKIGTKDKDETKIHVKVFTPEDVGLDDQSIKKAKPSCIKTKSQPVTNTKISVNKNDNLSKKDQEPIANRFEAQKIIIKKQLDLIEKQKQMINDLKAQHLETQSKLGLKVAESELATAPATFLKRVLPVLKTRNKEIESVLGHRTKSVNTNLGMAETLNKSMIERQEYCRQLAEMTRVRKNRIEEERAKLISEQKEKLMQEKEEQKRARNLKLRMEKQLAEENAKSALATKLLMNELTEKATKHYSRLLLKNTFNAFKRISFEMNSKISECNDIYKRKLMKRSFALWRSEVEQSLVLKNQLADRHYCTHLMLRCWNAWCLVRGTRKIVISKL